MSKNYPHAMKSPDNSKLVEVLDSFELGHTFQIGDYYFMVREDDVLTVNTKGPMISSLPMDQVKIMIASPIFLSKAMQSTPPGMGAEMLDIEESVFTNKVRKAIYEMGIYGYWGAHE